MGMAWPIAVTPEGPQALRRDQVEKQFLQSRKQGLKIRVGVMRFPLLGV